MTQRTTPWLTPDSVKIIEGLLRPNWKVIEFGAGGSTIWLSTRVSELVTIEHAQQWADEFSLATGIPIRCLPRPYDSVCDEFSDDYFDMALIDGRDRVLCCSKARRIVKPGGYLVLDNAERPRYRGVRELMSAWELTHTEQHDGPEAKENGVWTTDLWRKPQPSTSN